MHGRTSHQVLGGGHTVLRFFATLKGELIEPRDYDYPTRGAARADVFQYIEGFYNRCRLHSSIGYRTPDQAAAAVQPAASAA